MNLYTSESYVLPDYIPEGVQNRTGSSMIGVWTYKIRDRRSSSLWRQRVCCHILWSVYIEDPVSSSFCDGWEGHQKGLERLSLQSCCTAVCWRDNDLTSTSLSDMKFASPKCAVAVVFVALWLPPLHEGLWDGLDEDGDACCRLSVCKWRGCLVV